jgi:hypothetical protein
MPPEPTREELLAEVASLRLALTRQQQSSSPFVREVSGIAPANQPDLKTSQAVRPVSPAQVAVPSVLLGKSTDPTVIQSQIDGLVTVITSGVNSAGYGDKRTEFRSLTELRQILDGLREDLAEALGMGGRIRQIRMTTQADKGL